MSTVEIRPAPVKKSVVVKASVERSFAAFAGNIGKWWPRTHSIGGMMADVIIEGRPGGRWYERKTGGAECEWGKVLVWEPPARLVLAWQIDANWKYDPTFLTEVEVNFTALADGATRVDFEHRNLERFGDEASRVRDAFDAEGGWLGILESFVADAEASAGA